MACKPVKCTCGCGEIRYEDEMLYVVPLDLYFVDQKHFDEYCKENP